MHVRALLDRAARCFADNAAVVDGGVRVSYRELHGRVVRLAGALQGMGAGAGDRIAILARNRRAFLELYFASAWLDAILVPLNTRLLAAELRAILRDAEPCLLASDGALHETALGAIAGTAVRAVLALDPAPWPDGVPVLAYEAALQHAPAPPGSGRGGDQVAHLYYTSGTTGEPKGVMLTHRNVCQHALLATAELGLGERDVWGHFAPMFHLADAWAVFAVTQVGGRHVMVPGFETGAALAAIARERITITNLVPTMLNALVKDPRLGAHDLRSLRVILSGGAAIAPDVVREVIARLGCEYVQTYGMTETSPFLTMSLLSEEMRRRPEAEQLALRAKTGRPVLGVELRVVADDGQAVAADGRAVGEIQVRGETVTKGYWRQPETSAAAFTADGFLRTGDLAVLDRDGFVAIVDRRKDVINTGGEKVYSIEVENALYAHPAVHEAAVFALPDPRWGETVAAAVVLRAGMQASAAELTAFCRARLAGFKIPRHVRFLAALPRTGSGKIAKRLLRDA